jgi:hypothetical protein
LAWSSLLRQFTLGGPIPSTYRLRKEYLPVVSPRIPACLCEHHPARQKHWVIGPRSSTALPPRKVDGHTLSSLPLTVATRDEPRSQHPGLSRGIESLIMASIPGAESPRSRSDSSTPSTFSAKRKRDDSLDVHNHVNGVHDAKSEDAAQDSQSLIQDLVDVLKT